MPHANPPRKRPARCRVCRHRQNLSKHPREYRRAIRCKACGAKDAMVLDLHRDSGREVQITCRCDGLWFPHRFRSEGCNHRPTLDDVPLILDCIEQEESENPTF